MPVSFLERYYLFRESFFRSFIHRFISCRPAAVDKVYPLSLLAFVATAHTLSLSRTPSQQLDGGEREEEEEEGWRFSGRVSQVTGLDHIFRRHVKPKKQHEIKNLAKVFTW